MFTAVLYCPTRINAQPNQQTVEKFLDNFNWQGAHDVTRNNLDLISETINNIAIKNPNMIKKCNIPDCKYGPFVVSEGSVESTMRNLFGFYRDFLQQSGADYGYGFSNGMYHFGNGDGPTSGKTKVTNIQNLASGNTLVYGTVSYENDPDFEPAYFIAIVKPNKENKTEGLALEKMISID